MWMKIGNMSSASALRPRMMGVEERVNWRGNVSGDRDCTAKLSPPNCPRHSSLFLVCLVVCSPRHRAGTRILFNLASSPSKSSTKSRLSTCCQWLASLFSPSSVLLPPRLLPPLPLNVSVSDSYVYLHRGRELNSLPRLDERVRVDAPA